MRALSAYLGPPVTVSDAIPTSPAGDVAAFGLGWYPDEGEPLRMNSRLPVTRPDAILEVPDRTQSHCVVCHSGPQLGDTQPYRRGPVLFAFNGALERPDAFEAALTARTSDRFRKATASRSTEALMFLTFLEQLGDRVEADDLADALEKMVGVVQDLATAHGTTATFSAVVTNGDCLVTLRTGTAGSEAHLPPLLTLVATEQDPTPTQGRWVCTEPAFPSTWTPLDPHSLVIFNRDV